MPSTNFTRVARVREQTIGVTPVSPAMEYCYLLGESFKIAQQFVRDETIIGDRKIRAHEFVGIAVEGGGRANWAPGYHDWALELALMDTFAGLAEAYNVTADSAITQVTSSSQTMAAAGEWVEGMLIDISGLELTADKRFRAAAGSGSGSLVAPAATFSADEAAPPAGARALCVGIEGASGDISATATGLASASNVFADYPLEAGMAIKIGGTAAGNSFGTAALNDFAVIESIAEDGSEITLTERAAGWTTDSGSGKAIQIFIGDHAETGENVITDTLQKYNTKLNVNTAIKYLAVAAQTLRIDMALNSIVSQQLGVIGFTGGLLTSLLDASPADPYIGLGGVYKTGSNFARLSEGGAAIPGGSECQSLSLSLANNLTPIGSLQSDHAIDFDPGDAEVINEGVFRFGAKTIYEKYLNGDLSSQFFVIKRGSQAMAGRVASGRYTDGDVISEGRNGQVTARMRFEGSKHPTTGKLLDFTRFRAWK